MSTRPVTTPRFCTALLREVGLIAALVAGALTLGCESSGPRTAPDSAPAPTVSEQRLRLEAAQAALGGGDYAQALELFREILASNPTVAQAYMGIGQIHERQGNLAEAEPAFARAARLEPRNFDAQISHGRVLTAMKRYLEAIRAYHRALSIDPESFDANLAMAQAYLALKDPSGGLVFAEKAVRLQPGSGPARLAYGEALLGTGRTAPAVEQLETANELMEPTPDLLFALIRAYGEERRFEESANAARVLVRIAPSTGAYERLGWAEFRLGRYQQSIEAYRDAVRIDPDNWPALNGIGVNALNTWLLSNRQDVKAADEARESFRRSLRNNPNQPKVVRLLTTYQI